jgi:hypothetical protein
MNNQSESTTSSNVFKGSVSVPLGIALMILGIFAPRPLSAVARDMQPELKSTAFLLTDTLRLGFFGGIGCLIIGVIRKTKAQSLTRP